VVKGGRLEGPISVAELKIEIEHNFLGAFFSLKKLNLVAGYLD
jgi:hypothetical protein